MMKLSLGAVGCIACLTGANAAPVSYVATQIDIGFLERSSGLDGLRGVTPRLGNDGQFAVARYGRLVLWKDGITTEVVGPEGLIITRVWDMNRAGQILVSTVDYGTGAEGIAIYRDGEFISMGDSEPCCFPAAFDDSAKVIGSRINGDQPRGVYLGPGTVDPIPHNPLAGVPARINNSGTIVGIEGIFPSSTPPADRSFTPYFQNGAAISRPDPGPFWQAGLIRDMNENGIAVGWLGGDFRAVPVSITSDAVNLLPQIPGAGVDLVFGHALGINETGTIVGQIYGPFPVLDKAVLWDEGQAYDLNELVPGGLDGKRLYAAYDINDAGQIIAIGGDSLFLLTPVPEPGTLALMLCGMGILWRVHRVREDAAASN